jgi:uncharacterized OsmC-like protein
MNRIFASSIIGVALSTFGTVPMLNAQNNVHEVFVHKSVKTTLEDNAPSLHRHLLRRRQALTDWWNVPTTDLQPVTLTVVSTAKNRGGFRELRVREFHYIGDCGYSHGGQDSGVGTTTMATAVFASDLAESFLNQAALEDAVIDSLAIEIHGRPDTKPTGRIDYPRNFLYTIYVDSPESDETINRIAQKAEEQSGVVQFIKSAYTAPFEIDLTPSPRKKVVKGATLEGLREYIKGKRQAILAAKEAAKNAPKKAPRGEAKGPVVRVFPNGVRQLSVSDKYLILHDNPAYLGGTNLGMTSREGLLGVLATCITHISEGTAAELNLDVDSLQVEVKGKWDPRAGRKGFEKVPDYPQDIKFILHVKTPETLETVQKWLEKTEAQCPMYNMFKDTQTFECRVVRIKKSR